MKILIVDDKEEERYLAETLLKGSGYEVVSATNGAEALEKLRAEGFDMIISDILMPVMDGFRLCRECKGDEKLKDIPFVFYTATYKDERDEELASKVGADKYILKPIEPEEFVKIIQGLVRDIEEGKIGPKELVLEEEKEVLKLYSERLIEKLEKKMLELEAEITERRQAQEELQLAEQNFRNSLDNSPLGIRIVTAEGELLYANQAILDIYVYSSVEELKATPIKKRYTPKSSAEHQERKERRELGKPVPPSYEISIVRKDGEVRHLIVSRKEVLWNGEVQYQTLYQDITERKQAEEALTESEEKYRTLFESMLNGFAYCKILVDENNQPIDFVHLEVNNAWERLIGLKSEDVIGKRITEVIPGIKEAKTDLISIYGKVALTGQETKFELYFEPLEKWFTVSVYSPQKGYFVAIFDEITERKRAEENIKRAAEEWRTTFDSITDLVFISDKDYKLVRVNKAFTDVVKMKPVELIGRPCYEILHGTNEPVPNCPYKQTLKTKKPATAEFFEPQLGIHLEVMTSPIFDDKGEVVASVHIARDITERRKMEEQLMVTDRLASIGELASGIAHELNNPLTSVIGFSDLLLGKKGLPSDVKEDLRVINKEAQRTAQVVRNLLAFARRHAPAKQPVDIKNSIQKVLELRAYEQKVSNIEVNTQFAPDLPEITADGFQLQQVFLNIIINAEHFMTEAHGRGTLTITTERAGDIIRASFADDGPGIAKKNLGHVFDPFFTTKEVGKGTGLGLSISYGIITEHGGRIYAESKLGKGATFVVELPISK